MTWVLPALLALGSVYLFSNEAEFALKRWPSTVEGLRKPVSRPFADG